MVQVTVQGGAPLPPLSPISPYPVDCSQIPSRVQNFNTTAPGRLSANQLRHPLGFHIGCYPRSQLARLETTLEDSTRQGSTSVVPLHLITLQTQTVEVYIRLPRWMLDFNHNHRACPTSTRIYTTYWTVHSMVKSVLTKRKDPVGSAVFYPNSCPDRRSPSPPLAEKCLNRPARLSRPSPKAPSKKTQLPDVSPRLMSPSIDIPVTHRASITPSQEVLSLYDPLGNPPSPTSPCGRSDVDSNESPPTELRSMLESWNAFTPEQMPSTLSNSHSLDSFALMSPVSPEAIGLDELIDDNFTTSSRSVSINPFPILAIGYSPRKDSPYPHKPLFTYSTISEPASAQDSPEVRSASVEQSMTFTRVELGKPVPIRQMPWTTRTNASRTSSAPSSSRPVQLSASPLGGLFQPPTPAKSPRTKPLHAVDPVSDLFSPGYSIATGTAPLHPEPEHTNSLNLHLNTPTVTPRTAHESNASFHGSKIAAGHLRGKVLNPQFTQRFTVGDELGSGGFGFVCSAIQTGYDNAPGVEVAVKFVFKSRLGEDQEGEDTCGMIDGIPIEAHVLSRCSHPGVVGFVALYEDEEFFYLVSGRMAKRDRADLEQVQELHGDPWAAGHTLESETKAPQTSSSLPQLFALGMPSPYLPSPSEGSEWNFASPTPPTEMKEFIFPALSTSTPPLPIPQTPQKDWVQSVFPSYLPPTPITAPAKRPPMGRRASHDLFEAVEHRRFTEEQGRFIFKQIGGSVLGSLWRLLLTRPSSRRCGLSSPERHLSSRSEG